MRKDSEVFLKKALNYRNNTGKNNFELNYEYFDDIPSIEMALDDIVKDLIKNDCLTSQSGVLDLNGNISINLTLDGITYFDDRKEKEPNTVFHVPGGQVNIATDNGKIYAKENMESIIPKPVKKKTRFDDLINKRSELDLLKDYTPFSKVIPIISCGDEKVAKIVTYSDHFEMNVDISGVEERNMKEFAMALMKYIPCEDLSVFHDAGYFIEFDAAATGDIKAVQLEIKDDTGAKVVDKTNDISSEKRHFRYGLKNVVRNGVALEKISEICFTVFFMKSYIDGESGTLSISNLKMVPDNSGKLIEMDS